MYNRYTVSAKLTPEGKKYSKPFKGTDVTYYSAHTLKEARMVATDMAKQYNHVLVEVSVVDNKLDKKLATVEYWGKHRNWTNRTYWVTPAGFLGGHWYTPIKKDGSLDSAKAINMG